MNDAEVIETLVKLGLGTGEAKVYVALVTGGQDSATPLSKKAGVPQPKVYEYLQGLIDMGFVTELQASSRAKVYEAISPVIVIEELRDTIEKSAEMVSSALEARAHSKIKNDDPVVDFLMGERTVKRRLEDLIIKSERNIVFSSSEKNKKFFEEMSKKYRDTDFYIIQPTPMVQMLTSNTQMNISELISLQPTFMFTDVDFESKSCSQSAVFTPKVDNDVFMAVFTNSFAPHYQIRLLLTIIETLPFLEMKKFKQ